MATYGPPPGMSVADALYAIFTHYSTPYRSSLSDGMNVDEEDQRASMDGQNFSRMCKEAPDMGRYIARQEVELIFSKVRPVKVRRLYFDNFLDALLELSMKVYHEDDPTRALAMFISTFIFALFDQPPSPSSANVVEEAYKELSVTVQ